MSTMNRTGLSTNAVPLASIEEIDDDLASSADVGQIAAMAMGNGYINSSSNRNLIILTNKREVTFTTSSLAPNDPLNPPSNSLSPSSDDFGGLTTLTMASNDLLAQDEDIGDTGFFSSSISCSSKRSSIDSATLQQQLRQTFNDEGVERQSGEDNVYDDDDEGNEELEDDERLLIDELSLNSPIMRRHKITSSTSVNNSQEVTADLSNSLEDLVNSFDDKVKSCLRNYGEDVANLAPVQVRSPEEILNNRPAWWTLTGNYGSILPIDWTKMSLENVHKADVSNLTDFNCTSIPLDKIDDEEEEINLKHLIESCLQANETIPIKTADEVLEEIDAIMSGKIGPNLYCDQYSCSSEYSSLDFGNINPVPVVRPMSYYRFSLEKLKCLTVDQLQDLNEDLEYKVCKHSEDLVKALALRDELEFEKEIKNRFISLLLSIQNRRKEYFQRQQHQINNNNKAKKNVDYVGSGRKLRYLTTVIPYNRNEASDNVAVLQALIKIFQAMLEDNPTVPTLLTDYILKYICPNSGSLDTLSFAAPTDKSFVRNSTMSSSFHSAASLTANLNNKLKAARRSFSFRKNGNNGNINSSNGNNNNHHELNSIADQFSRKASFEHIAKGILV